MPSTSMTDHDEAYLLTSMREGRAVIVLGAGASMSSRSGKGPVPNGGQLAAILAAKAALPYDGEPLTEVLAAVQPLLGDLGIRAVLEAEYKGVEPSQELTQLFRYSWKRLYTWNIDDALDNLGGYRVQTTSTFNGLADRAAEPSGPQRLQIVYLHGQISRPEHGLIMTEVDYARQIKSDRHFWYQEAAKDYLTYTPVFIGSSMNEPILTAELERAKREGELASGRAYLVTPDDLSPIRQAGLKARGIVHIKGTLETFTSWLYRHFPRGLLPRDIVASSNHYSPDALASLTPMDLEAAQSLKPIYPSEQLNLARQLGEAQKVQLARQFLQGFPPSWTIAASDIPVDLDGISGLRRTIESALENSAELVVALGQAGSGKSTATMMSLLRIAAENEEVALYDLSHETKSVRNAFSVLRRVESRKAIVHVGDLFIFGGSLRTDLESLFGQDVLVVGTARSGEWNEHLSRYLEDVAIVHEFQRFVKADFDPLIRRLVEYVPAPNFRRMTDAQRKAKFASSKSQLLIALREATDSTNFTDTISSEFDNLPDGETKRLLVMVGIATIARVGMSEAMAREAYEQGASQRSFDQALAALSGIVADAGGGRLFARHELYVRHILEVLTPGNEFFGCLSRILKTYVKYETPIIKYVNRQDAALFRFLLNHDYVFENAKRFQSESLGIGHYSEHEIAFQLDGHFWLQYGLFMGRLGKDEEAVDLLTKSIRAYPDNLFASHALADMQLKMARGRRIYDAKTKALIGNAVATLLSQDARHETRTDQYPIVTLCNGHIGALLAHGQVDEAKELAPGYYDKLSQLEKTVSAPMVAAARERMLLFASTGEWNLPLREQRGYKGGRLKSEQRSKVRGARSARKHDRRN